MAIDLSEIESSELEHPTRRSNALAQAGFGMLLVKFKDPSRKAETVSRLVSALRSGDESIIICAINEYRSVSKDAVTVVAQIGDTIFVKPNTAQELSTILDGWSAEAHVITFIRSDDLQELPSTVSKGRAESARIIGFEDEYLLAFGPSRPTILLADTHNSAEIWGSQAVLEESRRRLKTAKA